MPKGGKREGAGRPRNNFKTVKIQRLVTPEEKKIIDELIARLKKERKNVTKDT